MKIPLLDLRPQHEPLRNELLQAITKVLDSNKFIQGPEVNRFEERVAEYCGTKFALGVSSGTDALLVSLMALGIGPGDEVVTTDYSFFATAGVIARLGAKPVFVDIDPVSFNIDPLKIESLINKNTKAIIAVHLYGQCADMDAISRIARKYNLKLIEDSAQSLGAEYHDGRRAGSIGDVGCVSFFPSKNLGGMGDGGMVVTNNASLAEKIKILRVHGAKPKYHHRIVGGNFRLDSMQAAILNVKIDYLDKWILQRQENALCYNRLFREIDDFDSFIIPPKPIYEASGVLHYHIYNQFIVRTKKRDALLKYLQSEGVGAEVYYPVPFHVQDCFSHLGYSEKAFVESERAAAETLSLPTYPGLDPDSIHHIVELISRFYRQ